MKSYPVKFESFQRKIIQMGALQKLQNFVQTLKILWPVYPIRSNQEIIKVREWIPHIGPLPKVIPLKLFLDMAPSSSQDITRAMRGQLKPLCRNYLGRNGGNVIIYVLISFHSRDVFYGLSCLFVPPGFRWFCARLVVHYLAVYSVSGN